MLIACKACSSSCKSTDSSWTRPLPLTAPLFAAPSWAASRDPSRPARPLVETAPDAVVYADQDGIIRFWNRGATRIFGHEAADAVGHTLDIIIPEGLRARHWTGYRATMASGATRYGAGDLLAVPAIRK